MSQELKQDIMQDVTVIEGKDSYGNSTPVIRVKISESEVYTKAVKPWDVQREITAIQKNAELLSLVRQLEDLTPLGPVGEEALRGGRKFQSAYFKRFPGIGLAYSLEYSFQRERNVKSELTGRIMAGGVESVTVSTDYEIPSVMHRRYVGFEEKKASILSAIAEMESFRK